MKLISVVSPCYNEAGNVEELCRRIKAVFDEKLPGYDYEHIIIDNASTDGTGEALRKIAADDKHVKVILNERNFGHIHSPYHAIMQARGDAVVYLASDLQDPPELIADFVRKWEEGAKVVAGVKTSSAESGLMFKLRGLYYWLVKKMGGDIKLIDQFTGFGLYDQQVLSVIREMNQARPYLRGEISFVTENIARVEFHQPGRKHGKTKNNWMTLFDNALIGFTETSKAPLRLAILVGLIVGGISFALGVFYLIFKLFFWESLHMGIGPMLIGLFFFMSVQLFFIGIIGEYVGAMHTMLQKRPHVVEKERINFASDD